MGIIIWLIIFVASLAVLIKASDMFTDSAEKIGLYLGLPAFIVGVTIVAIGTSLPELVSSLFAVAAGNSQIVIGNVLGSNIANIFLVLGFAAVFSKKMKLSFSLIHIDLPIFIASALLLAVFVYDGNFTFWEGIICIVGLIVYILYTVSLREKKTKDVKIQERKAKKSFKERNVDKDLDFKTWAFLILGSVLIFFSAKYVIESVVELSSLLNIGAEIIAVSAVALGTSLPELFVTISAARRGKGEMAIGNVLGSNVFNIFAVMGIPALFGTLIIPAGMLSFGLPIMLFATLLYFVMTQDRELSHWEGWFLLIFYVVFIAKTFGLF